jgi:hypothetical protein
VCFSPEADLVGGCLIGAIGVDTLRHSRGRRERALAALPALLAGHQLVEAFVWWGLERQVPAGVGRIAMWVYLLFAFCVLPVLVPAAVMGIEARRRRRRVMAVLVALGGAVAAILLASMLGGPVSAEIGHHHLAYRVVIPAGGFVVAGYIAATCLPLLFSAHPHVVVFGAANLAAALVLAWLVPRGFASVWCGWAAVSSGAIAAHLRFARAHRPPDGKRRPVVLPADA